MLWASTGVTAKACTTIAVELVSFEMLIRGVEVVGKMDWRILWYSMVGLGIVFAGYGRDGGV